MSKTPKHVKNGSDLAEALSLSVAEGRFHIDGSFYERPTTYPCAFFDKRGYIIVDSETALEKIARFSKEKVNFRRPVSKQRGYQVGENSPDWPALANARAIQKAKLSEARKLLENLSDEEKRQLIDKLK